MGKTKKGEVVQLAMVGCGGMAGAHLRGYEELLEKGETRFRFVAAVDEVPARAEDFAARINGFAGWEVNAYASVAELLAGGKRARWGRYMQPARLAPRAGLRTARGWGLTCWSKSQLASQCGPRRRSRRRRSAAGGSPPRLSSAAAPWASAPSTGPLTTVCWAQPKMWWAVQAGWNDPSPSAQLALAH